MLITRLFEPSDRDILYHYCSAHTFQTIIESGNIRFSDINMLNDPQEMHWGYSVFEEAAGKLIKIAQTKAHLKELNKGFFDKVDGIIGPLQASFHPFVSCFSREPSLLSQWQAYADDCRGFAIGFHAKALAHMPVSILAVEYDREKQVREMMDALGACFLENQAHGNKFGDPFFASCVMIGAYMLGFKDPKFKEEKEVRCLHIASPERDNKAMRLVDHGGLLGETKEVSGEAVRFRIRDDAFVAYIDMPFRREFQRNPIKHVVLGTANPNWPTNILYFTGAFGYEDVTVRKLPYHPRKLEAFEGARSPRGLSGTINTWARRLRRLCPPYRSTSGTK